MRFSIRRDVDLQSFEKDLSGLEGVPIELALPYILDSFLLHVDRLLELADYVRDAGILVSSVHAAQGRLSDPNFISWALPTVRFAEAVGAGIVVFHPERTAKIDRRNLQMVALGNVKRLQRETDATVAIETFANPRCVLTPEEILERKLPMILDTSHLFVERILGIIEAYSQGIASVHLSELRGEGKESLPHLPVESYGIEVLQALRATGWDGNVTLEYLPQFHDRLIPDRATLEELFR